jgi:hypothetical protein
MVTPFPDNFIDRAVYAWMAVKGSEWKQWLLNADTQQYESTKLYFCKPPDSSKKWLFEVVRIIDKKLFEHYYSNEAKLHYYAPTRIKNVNVQIIDKSTHKSRFEVSYIGAALVENMEVIEYNRDESDGVIIA